MHGHQIELITLEICVVALSELTKTPNTESIYFRLASVSRTPGEIFCGEFEFQIRGLNFQSLNSGTSKTKPLTRWTKKRAGKSNKQKMPEPSSHATALQTPQKRHTMPSCPLLLEEKTDLSFYSKFASPKIYKSRYKSR